MRPQKVEDQVLMDGLAKVFRTFGYEGASLKELSDETGLKKASLYHRFPNGKQEMAVAVLQYFDDWVRTHVFSALLDEKTSANVRLKQGLAQIKSLYKNGENSCIFRALSMDAGMHLFEEHLKNGLQLWIDAFTKIGLALDLTQKQAEENATQTLISIQGSLIVSKIMKDNSIFTTAIGAIENTYLNK